MPRPLPGQLHRSHHLSKHIQQAQGTPHNVLCALCTPLPQSPSSAGSSHARNLWAATHRQVLVTHGRLTLCLKCALTLVQRWCRPQQHLHRKQTLKQLARCTGPPQEVRGVRSMCWALRRQNAPPSFVLQVASFYSASGSPSPAIPTACRLTAQPHTHEEWEREQQIAQSVAALVAHVFAEASLQTPTRAMGLAFRAMAYCAVEVSPTAKADQEPCLCVPSSIDVVRASALGCICALPHHHTATEVTHFLTILVEAFGFYRHNAAVVLRL